MELYKLGKVVSIGKTYIIFESNYQGTIVYVARPNEFTKDKSMKLYVYRHKSEYVDTLYGFSSFKERILFEHLIGVSGVGPKTALNVLVNGFEEPINFIANGDVTGMSSYHSLGARTAGQIIFELKDKYPVVESKQQQGFIAPIKISETLKSLGFNKKQIDYAVTKVKAGPSIELMVEEAIVEISRAKFA